MMARTIALIFAGLCSAVSLAGLAFGGGHLLAPVIGSVLLLAGLAFERWRYKAIERGQPGPGWQASGERFVDPETGKPVEVWYQATTGERRYVALPDG